MLRDADGRLADARAADRELETLRADAFARFDAADNDAAETVWSQVLEKRTQVLALYRTATEAAERALLLDGSRSDARGAYAEILFERAVLAEREGLREQQMDLVSRLRLYDPDGVLQGRLEAPARLDVVSDPPGATVTLRRYEPRNERLVLGEPTTLGTTPLRGLAIPPGSVMLELRAEGRPPVLAPVWLRRGDDVALDVPIPASVPEGFVYVPPGRTVFGSGDADEVRRFFKAIPMHPATTGAYLIARHEITYGDWIAFLEDLPEADRADHMPNLASSGSSGGANALRRDGSTWVLDLDPTGSNKLTVRQGEPIRYEDRPPDRVEQDWLRVPISGINYFDLQAYTSWLDRTGRVPGARPCTEVEWERAARGADDRKYPHGYAIASDDANIDTTYAQKDRGVGPDEVGRYPQTRSPFGVDDLAGNVWEWVATDATLAQPSARGGAFYYSATNAAVANRETPPSNYADVSLGARVCATVPSSSQ
jgi:formylglycine-generating enzyme required for sulfatase activity